MKQITDTVDYTEVLTDGNQFFLNWHDNIIGTFDNEKSAIQSFNKRIGRDGTIFEYQACWIGYTSDLDDLAVKLHDLGLRSIYQNFDVFGSGSLKYVFQANESDMIQWRDCLRGHGLDPFYVHNVRQIG